MKKQLLYVLALSALFFYSTAAYAQNIKIRIWNTTQVVNNDTLTFYADPRWPGKVGCTFGYQNASNKKMILRAKKWDISLTPKAQTSMCFAGECYGPNDIISPNADTVTAASSSYLQGNYDYTDLQAMPPSDLVAFILYDEENPSDSAIVYTRFAETSTTFIGKAQGSETAMTMYPNPAQDIIVFEPGGADGGVLYITDVTGRDLNTFQISQSKSIIIPVDGWANGLYYYSFYNESGEQTTGKFIVAH